MADGPLGKAMSDSRLDIFKRWMPKPAVGRSPRRAPDEHDAAHAAAMR